MLGQFHVLEFDRRQEAAAFIAALSRFLYSPRAEAHTAEDIEVWALALPSGDGVRLYLSDGSLAAAEAEFSPVRLGGTIRGEAMPTGSFLMIKGGETPALGAAEAELRLTKK